ncbi:hypothetical protein E2C01_041754 [Portunus trituberculatus]|uniref:Uncharacterized protein n=1 Tax=Portunus trituberculatus TaxID=210409 RepID=A0A5B7FND6_PORTR|nr:hypothetical protein [Portunus trituberculatus]
MENNETQGRTNIGSLRLNMEANIRAMALNIDALPACVIGGKLALSNSLAFIILIHWVQNSQSLFRIESDGLAVQ